MGLHFYRLLSRMNQPEFQIQELSDGKLLVTLRQEGEPSTQMIMHPSFALVLGRRLIAEALGYSPESDAVRLRALL